MSLLNDFQNTITPFLDARRWLVAYSGGVDSHVLLHLLVNTPDHPPITAIHINHQLQDESDQWLQHCEKIASQLNVEFDSRSVDVRCSGGESLEDKARQARYGVFESILAIGDVLMMGHHRDDQVETLLLRMLRGSGAQGNAAIPQRRMLGLGQLFRPLLGSSREQIEAYATEQKLHWIEDPSNQSIQHDRNFLRQELFPLLEDRWPKYRATLARSAALSEEAAALNQELAEIDFHSQGLSPEAASLPIATIGQLSYRRQKNLLRYWLQYRGFTLPSVAQLNAVINELMTAREDAEPLVQWQGVQLRRFKDELYAMASLGEIDSGDSFSGNSFELQPGEAIDRPGIGTLSLKSVVGHGIRAKVITDQGLVVHFRQGGERCKPAQREKSQTLKKLFQEYQVEPWLRDRVPLLYCHDELVAVGDYWVCDGYQAEHEQQGFEVCWHRP